MVKTILLLYFCGNCDHFVNEKYKAQKKISIYKSTHISTTERLVGILKVNGH